MGTRWMHLPCLDDCRDQKGSIACWMDTGRADEGIGGSAGTKSSCILLTRKEGYRIGGSRMNDCIDGWKDVDVWTDGLVDKWMNGCIDGRMDREVDA